MLHPELNRHIGNIDLHLLDQILKGRYTPAMRILDAGCGEGRNLSYFVRNGFDVWGVDINPAALRLLRAQGAAWNPTFDPEKFIESDLADLPLPPERIDAVICCSVLHFAHDEAHFWQMADQLLHVLRPGGSLFIRMYTTIASPPPSSLNEPHWLLTQSLLDTLIRTRPVDWLEPLRIEQIANHPAQATLVLQKNS